jgi:hypothetical protein
VPDRSDLSGNDEESGLEGIFNVFRAVKNPPAGRKHHRAMSPQENLERRLIALAEIALQQIGVGQAAAQLRTREPANVPDERMQFSAGHA